MEGSRVVSTSMFSSKFIRLVHKFLLLLSFFYSESILCPVLLTISFLGQGIYHLCLKYPLILCATLWKVSSLAFFLF